MQGIQYGTLLKLFSYVSLTHKPLAYDDKKMEIGLYLCASKTLGFSS